MQQFTFDNLKKQILPGSFILYFVATIIAFIFHARYFSDILTKTFAEPPLPAQLSIDMPALGRVAGLIGLDQENINALTSSSPHDATNTPEQAPVAPAPTTPLMATTSRIVATSSATSTPIATTTKATTSKSTTRTRTK